MKIQTEASQVPIDTQLLSSTEQKVSKLASFFNHISEARVHFKHEYLGEKIKRVAEIKIHFPNGFIFIKESSKTFEAALSKALVSLKVQLLRYRRKK